MLKILPFVVLTLLASPALAGTSVWQDIAPGVKARLISADVIDSYDNTLLAGLELDMPKTTRTYWRIPGETGIPAQFDFSASGGLDSNPQIIWPYPEIDHTGGYTDYIYRGHFVLPMKFKVTGQGPALLSADATLGICSDVCVPAMAKFTLPVAFGQADGVSANALLLAIQKSPAVWNQPSHPFGAISARPDGLLIDSVDPSVDPDSIIADVNDPSILFGVPQKGPEKGQYFINLLGKAGAGELAGRSVQLTFTASSLHFPYAVTRPILPAR